MELIKLFIKKPRRRRPVFRLERTDLLRMLQGQSNVIQTTQQTILAERIDVEIDHALLRGRDLLGSEVDCQLVPRCGLGRREQCVERGSGECARRAVEDNRRYGAAGNLAE